MDDKEYPIRSDAQNRAMHKWFTQIADTLNDAGYEQSRLYAGGIGWYEGC